MKPQTVPVAASLHLKTKERSEAVLIDAAEASWEHYQETGLHVTLEEANAWMDAVIGGRSVGQLKCHK